MSRLARVRALLCMKNATTLLLGLLFVTACDTRLTLVADEPPPNEGEGEGEGEGAGEGEGEGETDDFCSLQPVEAEFPVKVLYVMDVSGSMQFVDQPGTRAAAMQAHIASLAALDDDVSVAVLGWGAGIFTDPPIDEASDPRFVDADEWPSIAPSFMGLQDVSTDMHAAFGAAYEHILSDATRVSPDERLRTRYVIVFVTDGGADPRCCVEEDEGSADPFGCPLEAWETAPPQNAVLCEGRAELELCNQEAALTAFREGWPDIVGNVDSVPNYGVPFVPFADFELDGDRNRIAQLEDDVRLLNSIEGFGVGAVDAHFFLLEDTTLPDSVKEIFQLNSCRLHSTIDALADAAGNTASIGDAPALDFGSVDVTPLCP